MGFRPGDGGLCEFETASGKFGSEGGASLGDERVPVAEETLQFRLGHHPIDDRRRWDQSHDGRGSPRLAMVAAKVCDRIFADWDLALALAVFDVGDLAVAHVEDAVGDLGGLGVVGDHEDGLVELAAGLAEHLEDGVGVFGVEVAGGLVGEDDGGAVDEGAGDGDALLFATGELVGAVIEAALDAEHVGEVIEEGHVECSLCWRLRGWRCRGRFRCCPWRRGWGEG